MFILYYYYYLIYVFLLGVRDHLFAYHYLETFTLDAWPLSDIRLDYQRMLLHIDPHWQVRIFFNIRLLQQNFNLNLLIN
jgi:hypothetical protein